MTFKALWEPEGRSDAHSEAHDENSTSFEREHARTHAHTHTYHELESEYHIILVSWPQFYSHCAKTGIMPVCIVNVVPLNQDYEQFCLSLLRSPLLVMGSLLSFDDCELCLSTKLHDTTVEIMIYYYYYYYYYY
jgi:hypothetical protein